MDISGNELDVDDWESIDETQLNSQVDKLKSQQQQQKEQQNGFVQNGNFCDEEFRPKILQRTQPENQKITILRRPNSGSNLANATNSIGNNSSEKPKHLKTLEQREKEYAEARLRILGSASSDDSSTASYVEDLRCILKPSSLSPNTSFNSAQQLIAKSPENIIREPRGPDGSRGFQDQRR